MSCELVACCRFFDDKMKDMPKSVDYIKKKFCYADYASCSRYMLFKQYGGGNITPDVDPDSEEVQKIVQCLRRKQNHHSVSASRDEG